MFVQVIQGRVADPSGVRRQMEAWLADLAPGATGWLGSTGGVTGDGRLVLVARFESEEAARRNSERPEQGAWWQEMAGFLDGEATFRDSAWVEVDTPGDPDRAGFVQVMQGRTSDSERARELMATDSTDWAEHRPDILGSLTVGHDDGGWTMAIYFVSEEAARAAEQQPPPAGLEAMMKELDSLSIGETDYFDLTEPWLDAPA